MLAAALRSRSALGLCRARASLRATARLSESITYSGGQASVGQGGFYGSGGARCTKTSVEWNQNCIAALKSGDSPMLAFITLTYGWEYSWVKSLISSARIESHGGWLENSAIPNSID